MEITLLTLTAFLASIFSVLVGFGAGLIFIPIGSLFLPIKTVIALATTFFIGNNIWKSLFFWKSINWKLVIWIGLFPIAFTIIGASILLLLPTDWIEKGLGLLLLFYVWDKLQLKIKLKLRGWRIALGGALYGFFSGLTGTGGPVKAAVLDHLKLNKETFIGTMAVTGLFQNIPKTILFTQGGLLTKQDLPLIGFLLIAGLVGSLIGKKLVKHLSPRLFRYGVLGVIGISGIKLLFL